MEKHQQWEYRVFSAGGAFKTHKDEDIQEFLNQWGAEGWELLSVQTYENTGKIRLYAKRALHSPPPRSKNWPA